MLRKISQNFVMQEAFSETMLRSGVYKAKELQSQPYICDFLLLEFLDSIWINEVYRFQNRNLAVIVKEAVLECH
jgi:hypothetical protein